MRFLSSWKVGIAGVVLLFAIWVRLALKQHELSLMETVAAGQVKQAQEQTRKDQEQAKQLKDDAELRKHWAEIRRCSAQGHQPVMGFGFDVVCVNNTAIEWTHESPPKSTP